MRLFTAILVGLLLATPLAAQKQQRDPLTDKQSQQIAEAGIDPNARVVLFTKFINEHADAIKALTSRASSDARARRLDTALQDFTTLTDELGDNLDTFADRKADIRKALKPLNDATPRWMQLLQALAGEPGFALARKEAIESLEELTDQGKRLLTEQTAYFAAHKDQAGQDRYEPQ